MADQSSTSWKAIQLSRTQLLLFAFVIVFQMIATFDAHADLRVTRRTDSEITIRISGTIAERDAQALRDIAEALKHRFLQVRLDSGGGDVAAAMQIGRFVRNHEGFTVIDSEDLDLTAKCYSSCALIFIAGVVRHNFGELGLHRPYLASAPQARQEIEKRVPLMLSQLKQFVAEMGITDSLYEQVVNTDPAKMVIYKSDETERLIPATDPVYAEITTSYQARRFGVTTSEMRQRERQADGCLKIKSSDAAATCMFSVLWGLNERIYRERHDQLVKTRSCDLREDEAKILQEIPRVERKDHPLWIKRETCERNFMLRL